MLNEYGLNGTFYVNPRKDYVEWLKPWRGAYLQGHEIGNHTVSHICGANFGWGKSLEECSLEEIEMDIVECSRRLREGIPEQEEFTFCYPCYHDYVGRGPARQSYVPVVAKHFIAGRGQGEAPNRPDRLDLHYLWSYPLRAEMGAQLIRLAEHARDGRWVILTFHGVGDGRAITKEALRELLTTLDDQRDQLWTGTILEVAKAVKAWRDEQGSAS